MIQRNLTVKNVPSIDIKRIAHSSFRSRACEIIRTSDPEIVEFIGLFGTSSLIKGSGRIAIVETEGATRVRVELELFPSNLALVLGVLSLLCAVFTLGITFLLFWSVRDQACGGIVHELDRTIDEISVELERR